jgi:hypothetical protein
MTIPKQKNPSEGRMDGEREEFERWAKDEGVDLDRSNGSYVYTQAHDGWIVWQAAIASRAQSTPQDSGLLGELERAISNVEDGWDSVPVDRLQQLIANYRGKS